MKISKNRHCVVITGSSKGIGFGLAKAFLAQGCAVVITARHQLQLEQARAELARQFSSDKILALPCDITQKSEIRHLWDLSTQHFGRVDFWVNNAGSCHAAIAFQELSEFELNSVVQTNIVGTMLASQIAMQGMLEQGSGQIFNMEGWGSRGEWSAGMTAYATTKRAVGYFSHALYKETKNSKILIGTLSPGMVATDLLISSWQHGNVQNWKKMKRLFLFVIDPVDIVANYLAKRMLNNQKTNVRIVWMTPLRLFLRFLQPYYWRRNPIQNTPLEQLK